MIFRSRIFWWIVGPTFCPPTPPKLILDPTYLHHPNTMITRERVRVGYIAAWLIDGGINKQDEGSRAMNTLQLGIQRRPSGALLFCNL